ncbi:hypothetical protein F2Q70_00008582 [Brassica cretica]|uniref:Uncharacterized protein n=1 Tax=Brassica cretica TaxID=69181 RepID=A0A8S9JAN6_BRACR|nr:hypothetical protein F2Q68_00001633 [Brassica cretica]KAF2611775.1 hypothetical protein F2Q70_00008582 [Brassica cretica]
MALEITSSGVLALFSKASLFLAVHRDHMIHGASGPAPIPVGGRQRNPYRSEPSARSKLATVRSVWCSGTGPIGR